MFQILHVSLYKEKTSKHRKSLLLLQIPSDIWYSDNNLKMLSLKAYVPFLQYCSSFKNS